MKFIIVDSVKGGCGKSVEALAAAVRANKAMYSDTVEEKDHSEKVCIIDLDILGTSIEQMLLGTTMISESNDDTSGIAQVYLNDFVYDTSNMDKTISTTLDIKIDGDETANVDIIMSSPFEEDRKLFRISSDTNYSMTVTPTHFRGVIKKLIDKLNYDKYTTIIFDMPPNSDPYTDTVFDLLLSTKRNSNIIESVTLEIVSNFDRAHINANRNWLKSIYSEGGQRRRVFDNIYFILNDSSCIFGLDGIILNSEKLSAQKHKTINEYSQIIKENIMEGLIGSTYKSKVNVLFKPHEGALSSHFAYKADQVGSTTIDLSDCHAWHKPIKVK